MKTKFIEAYNTGPGGPFNWGKFMVARFEAHEWLRPSNLPDLPDNLLAQSCLLRQVGVGPRQVFVMDLQTGEGALFTPGGWAEADLKKHNIWTCVLFPAFLRWLYEQDLADIDALPDTVEFSFEEAPPAIVGTRGDNQPIHK